MELPLLCHCNSSRILDNSQMASATAVAYVPSQVSRPAGKALPWFIYLLVAGSPCIPLGVLWDISWHSTIGRDTFWTPAHLMTYIGGLIPGLTCGWLAVKTHFLGSPEERAHAVS